MQINNINLHNKNQYLNNNLSRDNYKSNLNDKENGL